MKGERELNSEKTTARSVGAFILISYLGLIVSAIILGPILDAPDYLANIYPNAAQLRIGVIVELANAVAVLGIAVMMYPLLKQHKEGLALGYVGLRIIEAVIATVGSISRLTLIEISHEYIQAGAPADSYFETLATLALAQYHWAYEALTVFFVLGALIFYYLLYRTELIPRFISVWGLIAVISLIILNVFAPWLGVLGIVLALPIVSNEIFLAIWLIVKGFNSSAIASESA